MAAHQVSLSLGFSGQEYWSPLPFPSPTHESEKWKCKSLSRVRPSAIPWTAAFQAPLSMRFPRQKYWSGFTFPSLGNLPDPEVEPGSPVLQADLSLLSHQGKKVSWKESIENWVATICYVLLVLTEKYMLWCTQEPPIFTCTTQIEYSLSECAMMVVFKIIAPNSSIIGSLDALKLESYYSRVEDS